MNFQSHVDDWIEVEEREKARFITIRADINDNQSFSQYAASKATQIFSIIF